MADHLFWWILSSFSVCKLSASSLWTSQMYMGFEINCWILSANNSKLVDCSWTIQQNHLKFQILATSISFDCFREPEAHLQLWCKCKGILWTALRRDSRLTLVFLAPGSVQKTFLFSEQKAAFEIKRPQWLAEGKVKQNIFMFAFILHET